MQHRRSWLIGRRIRIGIADGLQGATFAAGRFWGLEAAFCEIKGVVSSTVGYTYRSAIFVHDAAQAAQASLSLAEHKKQLRKASITEVVPAETFWKAED